MLQLRNYQEKWKDVPTFEGFYQANKKGLIRNSVTKKVKTSIPDKNGYLRMSLWKNGKGIRRGIHQLIAKTFIPNPENKKIVNHKDGVKINNHVNNLEWCTYIENEKHAIKYGLKATGEKIASHKLTATEIIEIRQLAKQGMTLTDLHKVFEISTTHVSRIVRRIWWKQI